MRQEPRTHILKFRTVNRDIFNAIRDGSKKVETRARTVRYQNMKAGDRVKLACGKSSFQKTIARVRIFKTVKSLLRVYMPKDINPHIESAEELNKMYDSFPGYRKKIEKYGIVAFELKNS